MALKTITASLARSLALSGVWLSIFLILSIWVGVVAFLAPAKVALNEAGEQLLQLDNRLTQVQSALTSFDVLTRPEAKKATHSLGVLAQQAQSLPVLQFVLPPETLKEAVILTKQLETAVNTSSPLPALNNTRSNVFLWKERVLSIQKVLTSVVVGIAGLLTFFCLWFALGQIALYRSMTRRIRPPAEIASFSYNFDQPAP